MFTDDGVERRKLSSCSSVSSGMVLLPSKYRVRCLLISFSRSIRFLLSCFLVAWFSGCRSRTGVSAPVAVEEGVDAVEVHSGCCRLQVAPYERFHCFFGCSHRVDVEGRAEADALDSEVEELVHGQHAVSG